MKKENNYIVIPITILIVGIITIILALLESGWYYYLLGSLVGIMCHALLIKQSIKIKAQRCFYFYSNLFLIFSKILFSSLLI